MEKISYIDFYERLNKYATDNKVRQIDLVKSCGVSKSYISELMNCKRDPSLEFLTKLSEVTGKSLDWWVYWKETVSKLRSLNAIIDTFLESNTINKDGSYDKYVDHILKTMLDREIKSKLRRING